MFESWQHGWTHEAAAKRPAVAVCAFLLFLGAAAHAQVSTGAGACDRTDGSLTRFVLCAELQTRRSPETHAGYYAELEEIESTVLSSLPRRKAHQRRNILTALYHANRDDTAYSHRLTLVETLDARRGDPRKRLSADCDVFSLINAGISERYYGGDHARHGVVLVRTRPTHVMTATRRGLRLGGLLETENGAIYRDSRRFRSSVEQFELMTEPEIVGLYLAHVGLALALEGRTSTAVEVLDDALAQAPGEYVAHVGKALTLLLAASATDDPNVDPSKPWCAAGERLVLLDEAARSAEAAIELERHADAAHSLLGRIALHQCRPATARVQLELALEARPDPVDLYYLGLIENQEADLDRAIRVVRRGHRLARATGDPRYHALQREMEFMLAHALARRSDLDESRRDLRRAMHFLEMVQQEFAQDEAVEGLEEAIRRMNRRIGPARSGLRIPLGLNRGAFLASYKGPGTLRDSD
jgi:tetratricopeptide (TPR) repeat protein